MSSITDAFLPFDILSPATRHREALHHDDGDYRFTQPAWIISNRADLIVERRNLAAMDTTRFPDVNDN